MRREQRRNGLNFQDDGLRDDKVGPEAQRKLHALVKYRDAKLPQHRNTSLFKLKAHTRRIDRFQQSWSGLSMNLDRQPNSALSQVSMLKDGNASAALRGPPAFSAPEMKKA